MVNGHIEKYSALLISWEMQIKDRMRHYLFPGRPSIIKQD